MSTYTVSWLFRRKRELGNFSIENSFTEVIRAWTSENKPQWVEVSHFSEGLIKRLKIIRETGKIRTEILHITGDIHFAALAWPRWRKNRPRVVLTIHDIGFLTEFSGLKRWLFRKFWIQWPLRCVDHLVVVSTATKETVLKEVPWFSVTKITVIPSVVPQHFHARTKPPENPNPVALHVGLAANKNLIRHAQALCGMEVHLRIIGEPGEAEHVFLKSLQIDYSFASQLSEEEMQAEYSQADFLLFASTLEGFGMPIIEANMIGIPVITGAIEPMNSIAGDAAIFCDPLDVSSIRKAIERLLQSPSKNKRLVQNGFENATRFSPENSVQMHEQLYNKLSSTNPSKNN